MNKIKKLLYAVFILYIFGGVYLYFFQRDFIYYNTQEIKHNERNVVFNIQNEDIKIIVLNENKENAILYFPGRSEIAADNISKFKRIFPNKTVYLINYRGYGGSSGIPTEKNLFFDASFIYTKIQKEHKNITVVGRSLGSGIASYIAQKFEIFKLVLVTPYDSIVNMAKDKYPYYPISLILKDKYDSLERVKNLSVKTLIILASEDKTVPAKYSNNLINAFNKKNLRVKTIKDSGHGTIVDKDEYLKELSLFIN